MSKMPRMSLNRNSVEAGLQVMGNREMWPVLPPPQDSSDVSGKEGRVFHHPQPGWAVSHAGAASPRQHDPADPSLQHQGVSALELGLLY